MHRVPTSSNTTRTLIRSTTQRQTIGRSLCTYHRLSVDHHPNIQEILNQAYSYVLDDTTSLTILCIWAAHVVCWTGRALHREHGYHFFGSIHTSAYHGRISSSRPHSCHHSHSYPDALVDDTAKLDSPIRLNSIDQMVTSDESSYILLFANGRESGLEASWWYKIERGCEGKGQIFHRCGRNFE